MAWRTLSLAALLALQPLASQAAVSANDFLVTTTADLVDLCSVGASDEMHTARSISVMALSQAPINSMSRSVE